MKRSPTLIALALFASAAVAADAPLIDRFQRIDAGRWMVSDGWSNGDWLLTDWRRSQIATGPSGLTVTLDKNAAAKHGYSSGEIQSRAASRYGYFEARMRAAAGSGVVTGFFTYIGPPQGRPWNEVDVEILGRNTRAVQLTYHTGKDQRATSIALPFDAAEQSHVYGFDWQPTYIRWYIDGKLAHEETGAQLPLPAEPQKIFFDLWSSNSVSGWLGPFAWPGRPITAQLRCIATAPHFTGKSIC